VTRQRLVESTATNFIANFGGTFSKSSQWITLWVPDALRLLEDRETIKMEWALLSPGNTTRFRWRNLPWAQQQAFVSGGFDELLFVHEAHKRNMTIRNETLTHSEWASDAIIGGIRPELRPKHGHPGSWVTDDDDNLRPFLTKALRDNRLFFRKVGKGAMPFFMRHLMNFTLGPQTTTKSLLKSL